MSTGPQWADTAIWWHAYPLGFVGADTVTNPHGEVNHQLGRITAWLDDLLELGCNGLLLGPIFDSESHGYDTVDHLRVDPRLGDDTDAGDVPLSKVSNNLTRMKAVLTKEETAVVNKRLKSLGGMRPPIPAGVDPSRVRVDRKAMRGK